MGFSPGSVVGLHGHEIDVEAKDNTVAIELYDQHHRQPGRCVLNSAEQLDLLIDYLTLCREMTFGRDIDVVTGSSGHMQMQ